ncbi:glycosyltransferase [Rubrivirga sp. IMCC45206]|uniref:glycosyltransferase n=1 Tax=Rubrivirga sp. IMCC45206 TaxID=3391614 RepID=UPI00398FC8D9
MHVSPAPPLLAPATATVDVSVVIVTYNVREFLEQALRSVEAASAGLSVETWVVDNDSADGSVEMVRERFPNVRLIANEANVGFATANNQAIRQAAGRHVLVLNPDTILQEDTLRTLVAFMDDHPDAGAAGCRILNPDGTFAPESRRSFPTPAVAFYRIAGLSKLFPQSPTFGRYNLTHLPLDEVCEVDALSGSCMMVRKDAVLSGRAETDVGQEAPIDVPLPASPEPRAAGLFDEAFFMYGEDLDWCYRIQQAGWRIYYTPDTQIVHYKGESTKKGDLRYVLLFYGAMLRFVEKHVTHRPGAGPLDRVASAGLALGIRLGIIARAAFAAAGRLGRAIAKPVTDGVLALAALTATALGWSVSESFQFGASYYAVVLPAYAAILVIAVGLGGGYRSRALRPVLGGALLAGLAVAAVSYFVPTVAFSRAVLAFGLALATALLLARRVRTRGRAPRRALLVGAATEAARLQRLLDEHARGDAVVGYVADAPTEDDEGPAYAGRPRQLRDLARLSGADDVVFAADSLTNTAILDGMRALRELPVQLKILASGRDRVIGKASIEDFAAPLQAAERTVAPLRSPWTRRAVELPVASALLLLSPLFRAFARAVPSARTRRLAAVAGRMPSVLAGRRALVGYDADGPHPPPSWGLTPGVVSVLDTRRARPRTIAEAHRAYWFYARHQSAWLDVEILLRALLSGDD